RVNHRDAIPKGPARAGGPCASSQPTCDFDFLIRCGPLRSPPACAAEGVARRRLAWFLRTKSGLLMRIATGICAQAAPFARSIKSRGGGGCGFVCAGAAHGVNSSFLGLLRLSELCSPTIPANDNSTSAGAACDRYFRQNQDGAMRDLSKETRLRCWRAF